MLVWKALTKRSDMSLDNRSRSVSTHPVRVLMESLPGPKTTNPLNLKHSDLKQRPPKLRASGTLTTLRNLQLTLCLRMRFPPLLRSLQQDKSMMRNQWNRGTNCSDVTTLCSMIRQWSQSSNLNCHKASAKHWECYLKLTVSLLVH